MSMFGPADEATEDHTDEDRLSQTDPFARAAARTRDSVIRGNVDYSQGTDPSLPQGFGATYERYRRGFEDLPNIPGRMSDELKNDQIGFFMHYMMPGTGGLGGEAAPLVMGAVRGKGLQDLVNLLAKNKNAISDLRGQGYSWKEVADELNAPLHAVYREASKTPGMTGDMYKTGPRYTPPTAGAPRKWTPEYGHPGSSKWQAAFGRLPKPPASTRPWGQYIAPDAYERIIDRMNEGWGVADIVKETGLKPETVQSVFDYDKSLLRRR